MAEAIPGHIHCLRCRRQWIGTASERCPFCTRAAVAQLQANLAKMSREPKPALGQGYAVAMESAAVWLYNALTGEQLKDLPREYESLSSPCSACGALAGQLCTHKRTAPAKEDPCPP